MKKINLNQAFAAFSDHWRPRIAGELNDSYVKLVRLKDEFVWHHHDEEDELFLVVAGVLTIRLREDELVLHPGEFAIIPRGVEHCPAAEEEVQVLLLEPKATRNTGNVASERTADAEWLPAGAWLPGDEEPATDEG